LKKAADHLEFVVNLNPNHAHAFELLGEVRAAQGNLQAAAMAKNMSAWLLATSPVDSRRNGKLAVQLAAQAATITGGKVPGVLDTLAAAYAEVGDFSRAADMAQHAYDMTAGSDPKLAEAIGARVELYKTKQPFRDQRTRASVKIGGG
jgi:tetratricopeptide (TPR) repeat protein